MDCPVPSSCGEGDELKFLQDRLSSSPRHGGQPAQSPDELGTIAVSVGEGGGMVQSFVASSRSRNSNPQRWVHDSASPAFRTGHYRPARLLIKEPGPRPGSGETGRAGPS